MFNSATSALIGKTLRSRYKIIQKLGSGGFGDTYLAQDSDLPFKPYCVVKHLSPKGARQEQLAIAKKLFNSEAEVLYRLGEHNQIPCLYAHFCEDDEFYLVQEFIDGHDLSAEIRPGTVKSKEETIGLLQSILSILIFVHQQGVIHRDIKPQNIIRRKQDGKLVLIDFGTVKNIGTQGVAASSTIAIGTPGYMAPEQMSGHPKLCSDIFAVGMIGIQALTGLTPNSLLKNYDTLEVIWHNKVCGCNKLKYILDKMVAYHFNQRYQNASVVLEALSALRAKQSRTQNTTVNLLTVPTQQVIVTQNPDNATTSLVVTPKAGETILQQTKEFELTFEKGIDYALLRDFLKAGLLKEADKETTLVMLQAADRESESWLRMEDIEKFPCDDLCTINSLWVTHTNKRFGFSIQKQLFQSNGGTKEYDPKIWEVFGEQVGWFQQGKWLSYRNLNFDYDAPMGCFPTFLGGAWGFRVGTGGGYLLTRGNL